MGAATQSAGNHPQATCGETRTDPQSGGVGDDHHEHEVGGAATENEDVPEVVEAKDAGPQAGPLGGEDHDTGGVDDAAAKEPGQTTRAEGLSDRVQPDY